MVLKFLRRNSIKMNSKWCYITIKAYRNNTHVFWFPPWRKLLNHDPTEFTARKQGAVSDQWTTQDQKSFFSVQETSCNFSNIQYLNERFPSYNGTARQYCICLEKLNYNDTGTALDFRQENDFRITTLLQR